MSSLKAAKFEREPENVPGPFYVAKDQCIICMLPVEMAPDLIGFQEGSTHALGHCYFKKQPTTSKETELAIETVGVSCCAALRYCGNDQTIIDKILNGGNPDAVD
jgi:hypothetical protein